MRMKWILGIIILTACCVAFNKKPNKPLSRAYLSKTGAPGKHMTWFKGAIIRGDSTQKKIALVFTADEFAEGGDTILSALKSAKVKGSFFFTGRFYRNPEMSTLVKKIRKEDHYLGAHSDEHLLYCDWGKRDSLLVSRTEFRADLEKNYREMKKAGVPKRKAPFFLPPYEWYNDSIAAWTKQMELQLINFTPGTRTPADYTWPGMNSYRGSEEIYRSVMELEKKSSSGLNGFILLIHTGTDPRRTDKFYHFLPQLIRDLKSKGYQFQKVDELLAPDKN